MLKTDGNSTFFPTYFPKKEIQKLIFLGLALGFCGFFCKLYLFF